MDVENEVLDWGGEEDDHYERQRRPADDVDDTVSLGGEEDDMQELRAFQSRTGRNDVDSSVEASARPYSDRERELRREPSDHNLHQRNDLRTPDKRRSRGDRGTSPPRHTSQKTPLIHASLPPKPVTTNSQYRAAPQSSLMSASAMSDKQRVQEKDKEWEKTRANGTSQHPVIDEYGSLPPDWEVRRPRGAENTGQIYYYNTRTEQSQWHRPGKPLSPRRDDRDDRDKRSQEPRGSPVDTRASKHADTRDSGRNNSRNGLGSTARSDRLTFDERHYRPSDADDGPVSRRPPPQSYDRSPSYVPKQAEPREAYRGREDSPPGYRQDIVDERTAPPIPSRYSENGDHPTIRPRHDPTDSRPADRGREDTPRNFARAPKTTVADWPVSDRRGPPVQPHTVARDVPPERRESYRDSYADRDHGDASRSDIARLPPQRWPRSRSPSPVQKHHQERGHAYLPAPPKPSPAEDARREEELSASQRAVKNAYKAVSQRRQEVVTHDRLPRRPRDFDDNIRTEPLPVTKRRKVDDDPRDLSPPLREIRSSEHRVERRVSPPHLARPASTAYPPRPRTPRSSYDETPHLAPGPGRDSDRVERNERPPERPPPSSYPPTTSYRNDQSRFSPRAKDPSYAERYQEPPSPPRRNIPTGPAERDFREPGPPARRMPSRQDLRNSTGYERETNGLSRVDSYRPAEHETRRQDVRDYDRRVNRNADTMDVDVPPRYRSPPPRVLPINDRMAGVPPRIPVGVSDRAEHGIVRRPASYDRDYEPARPRDWNDEEVAPRAPRAMSSRSGGPSPHAQTVSLPPASASCASAEHAYAYRDLPRRPSSVRSDEGRRMLPIAPGTSSRDKNPALVVLPHKRSRFGGKADEPEGRREWREARNPPISAASSTALSRGSSYNEAPQMTRDMVTTTPDDPDSANPFEDEKPHEDVIEEKRSKVKSVFQDIIRQQSQAKEEEPKKDHPAMDARVPSDISNVLKTPAPESSETANMSRQLNMHPTRASRFSRPADQANERTDARDQPQRLSSIEDQIGTREVSSRSPRREEPIPLQEDVRSADTQAQAYETNDRREPVVRDYAYESGSRYHTLSKDPSDEQLPSLARRLSDSRPPSRSDSYDERPRGNSRDRVGMQPNVHSSRMVYPEDEYTQAPSAQLMQRDAPPPRSSGPVRIRRPEGGSRPLEESKGGYEVGDGPARFSPDRAPRDAERDRGRESPATAESTKLQPQRSATSLLERLSMNSRERGHESPSLRDRFDPSPRKRGGDHYEPPRWGGKDVSGSAEDDPHFGDGPPRRGRARERPRSGRGRRGPRNGRGSGPNASGP